MALSKGTEINVPEMLREVLQDVRAVSAILLLAVELPRRLLVRVDPVLVSVHVLVGGEQAGAEVAAVADLENTFNFAKGKISHATLHITTPSTLYVLFYLYGRYGRTFPPLFRFQSYA